MKLSEIFLTVTLVSIFIICIKISHDLNMLIQLLEVKK